ncbi:MAG: HEAT repeat domain-containing protein [Elainellaceae cyanobacterium]
MVLKSLDARILAVAVIGLLSGLGCTQLNAIDGKSDGLGLAIATSTASEGISTIASAKTEVASAEVISALIERLKRISRQKDAEPHVTVVGLGTPSSPSPVFDGNPQRYPADHQSAPRPVEARRMPAETTERIPIREPVVSNSAAASEADDNRVAVTDEAAIPAIMYLSPENWAAFKDALTELIQLGEASVPALVRLLNEEDPLLREAGVYGLGQIGPEAAAAAPRLVYRLQRDRKSAVRLNAAQALASVSATPSSETIAALTTTFLNEAEKARVRETAAEALARMALGNIQLRPLSALVQDYERSADIFPSANDTAIANCDHISNILSDPVAIAALTPLLDRGSLETRLRAVQILTLVDAPEADAALNSALRNTSQEARLAAVGGLLLQGKSSDALIPALVRLRQSADPGAAAEASRLLAIAQGTVPIAAPDSVYVTGVNEIDFLVVDFLGQFGQRNYSPEAEYGDHVVLGLQCALPEESLMDVQSLYYSFASRWPW